MDKYLLKRFFNLNSQCNNLPNNAKKIQKTCRNLFIFIFERVMCIINANKKCCNSYLPALFFNFFFDFHVYIEILKGSLILIWPIKNLKKRFPTHSTKMVNWT